MPRTVTCQIIDQPDGRFAVVATMAPGRVYRREGIGTLSEAEAWIDGLRALMAACSAPVISPADEPVGTPAGPVQAQPTSS